MLRLTIEICPHGDPVRAQVLASLDISNVSPTGARRADYIVDNGEKVFRLNKHDRELGYWPLIRRIAQRMEKQMRCKKRKETQWVK